MLGMMLRDNMMDGRPSRLKDYTDYTGFVIPPCGEFVSKSSSIEPPPWMPAQANVGFSQRLSLHREIEHFMAYMRPTKDEVYLRRNLIARFTAVIKKITPISTVRPVGSCVTGLYFPTSDIEMVIDSLPIPLSLLENEIWNSGFASRIDSLLDDFAAPLLRIVDAVTGIEIALSVADGHAVRATNAVQAWFKGDTGEGNGDRTVIACLVMVLKMFLSIRRLGSTYTGGVHSYLLFWMVVAWVKLGMPRRAKLSDGVLDDAVVGLRSVSMASSTSSSSSQGTSSSSRTPGPSGVPVDLGSALLGFLRFYGQEFDYENKSIQFSSKSVRYTSKPFLHRTIQKYLLCITDPADSTVDLGFKAYGIKHVRETFRDAQIKAIDKGSVHRITSGQVVVDLQTAVKELVENSLDAGSTNIEIRFKNYGLKSIDVIDNGSGIAEDDFESIGLKHHTSKLETYEDLNVVQTFGFRGEALSSLCALCEKVSVTTATKETSPKGTSLHLRKTGEVGTREVVARQSPLIIADFTIPTASCDVNVSPDKRTILLHNEANLILALKEALESHFSLTRSTFNLSSKSQSMTQTVLQPVVVSARQPRQTRTQIGPVGEDNDGVPPEPSSPGQSSMTLASVGVSQASSSSTHSQPPLKRPDQCSNGVDLDGDETLDVVVDTTKSPWARKTLTQPVITRQSESRRELSPPQPPSPIQPSLTTHRTHPDGGGRVASVSRKRRQTDDENSTSQAATQEIDNSPPNNRLHEPSTRPVKKRLVSRNIGAKLASFAMPGSQLASLPASQPEEEESRDGEDQGEESGLDENQDEDERQAVAAPKLLEEKNDESDVDLAKSGSIPSSAPESHTGGESPPEFLPLREGPVCDDADDDSEVEDPSSVLSSARETISAVESSTPSHDKSTLDPSRPEIIRFSDSSANVSVRFDIHKVRNSWTKVRSTLLSNKAGEGGRSSQADEAKVPNDAGVLNSEDQAKAAHALSRVIDKADFASMDIIGQFNLGFIIARRRKPLTGRTKTMDDLFIVDQHAADEKYNFENLQLTTKIQSQKLLRPRILELTAADELVASENIQILKDNGFEVQESDSASMGGRLQLMAQPVSKNTVFNIKDLEELIHLLRDSPSGTMVRCSKARAMFASRACRKSVMVGMPLNQNQMYTNLQVTGSVSWFYGIVLKRLDTHGGDVFAPVRGTIRCLDQYLDGLARTAIASAIGRLLITFVHSPSLYDPTPALNLSTGVCPSVPRLLTDLVLSAILASSTAQSVSQFDSF
ncbi:hypothetical protein H1R20_g6325, partial [Candolleomyces eurysporus]